MASFQEVGRRLGMAAAAVVVVAVEGMLLVVAALRCGGWLPAIMPCGQAQAVRFDGGDAAEGMTGSARTRD
jgi:hypothetical protein